MEKRWQSSSPIHQMKNEGSKFNFEKLMIRRKLSKLSDRCPKDVF